MASSTCQSRKDDCGTDTPANQFSCPQVDCVNMFKSSVALWTEALRCRKKTSTAGSQRETTHDAIKRKWVAMCTSIRPSYVSSDSGNRGTGGGGGGHVPPPNILRIIKS